MLVEYNHGAEELTRGRGGHERVDRTDIGHVVAQEAAPIIWENCGFPDVFTTLTKTGKANVCRRRTSPPGRRPFSVWLLFIRYTI
jgi:hypothetical protein